MRIALLDTGDAGDDAAGPGPLARALALRAHDVTILSAVGGDRASAIDRVSVERLRRLPPLPARRFYEDDLDLAPAAFWRLLRGRFAVAHAFAPALGWAAAKARRFGGPPFVYSFRGELTRQRLVDRHYRLEMMLATAAAAAACFVDDADTAVAFRRYLLREPEVVEPGAATIELYEAAYARCASGTRPTQNTTDPTPARS